jgi:ribose 5-phosphate isomerase B
MSNLTIGIASDHGGKELKKLIVDFLAVEGHSVKDFGIAEDTISSVDYPDYAEVLAENVSAGKVDKGIAICGTGIGMSIVANKFANVRAALIWDEYTAKKASQHNNANIACLGARTTNHHRAIQYIKTWLTTPYEGGRHQQRIKKIFDIEKKNFLPKADL